MSDSVVKAGGRGAPTAAFPLGRSPRLAAAFCLAGAAALVGVWSIIALPAPVRAALSALTLWGAWAAIARHALRRGKRACLEVRFPDAGPGGGRKTRRLGATVIMRLSGGESARAAMEEVFFSAWLVVLRTREVRPADLLGPPPPRGLWAATLGRMPRRIPRRRRETVIVPADCMDAESHRRFRIRARRAWSMTTGVLRGDAEEPRSGWEKWTLFFSRLREGMGKEKE